MEGNSGGSKKKLGVSGSEDVKESLYTAEEYALAFRMPPEKVFVAKRSFPGQSFTAQEWEKKFKEAGI